MNTAIIGPFFSSSGTSRHVQNIFRGLSEISPDVVVLISFRESNETLSSNADTDERLFVFNKIPFPENFDEFSDFIAKIVVKHKINVLLPQIKPFILLSATLAKQKLEVKNHTVTIIGTWHSNFSWIMQAPYHLAMARIGIQQCDGIIPVSEDVSSSLKKYLNYPTSRITSIIPPGGIDFEYINKSRSELLAKTKKKFSIEKKYIIFLGRLLYNKGIDTLIKSFKNISTDIQLVIIGNGPYKDTLTDLIEKLKLKSNIIFTGFISDDEVYALLQGAEIYCLPSRWESFSISTLEAMGAGCPIICSNVGGLGVWASKAAVMINPDNVKELTTQLNRVISDNTLLDNLRQKSQNLAKLYDYKEIARQTQKAIENTTSNPVADLDDKDPIKLTFDLETGEIKNLNFSLSNSIPEKMRITNFALYFPSEALENEGKGQDPELQYFL